MEVVETLSDAKREGEGNRNDVHFSALQDLPLGIRCMLTKLEDHDNTNLLQPICCETPSGKCLLKGEKTVKHQSQSYIFFML